MPDRRHIYLPLPSHHIHWGTVPPTMAFCSIQLQSFFPGQKMRVPQTVPVISQGALLQWDEQYEKSPVTECFYLSQHAIHHTVSCSKKATSDWPVPPAASITAHFPTDFPACLHNPSLGPQQNSYSLCTSFSVLFSASSILTVISASHHSFATQLCFFLPSTVQDTISPPQRGYEKSSLYSLPWKLWELNTSERNHSSSSNGQTVWKIHRITARPYFIRLKSILQKATLME